MTTGKTELKNGKMGNGNFPNEDGKKRDSRPKRFFKKSVYFQWTDFPTGNLGFSGTDSAMGNLAGNSSSFFPTPAAAKAAPDRPGRHIETSKNGNSNGY